ncbi:hypothetical protein [Polaribacter sp. Q13]|uniref:hypothetical protein n=1 Tax=Polaribacter sp. Q13 TaxID=2806551 RepID=UPI00193B5B3E|nr:hypothetical protein [Polaribacter sp. Q13]QVY66096.1 hypothetical protein JOP69_02025 [Polaribacter sp. Q13]
MKKIYGSILVIIFCFQLGAAQNKKVEDLEVKKGTLLFSDDFERTEIGNKWEIKEKFIGAFSIENGVLVSKEIKDAGHGSVTRAHFKYADVLIEFEFKFEGGKRFNIVMDDSNCKAVHAGHISRVSFSKMGFTVQDDKTGSMNLKLRNEIKGDPKKKAEFKKMLASKKSIVKLKFEEGKFYHAVITKKNAVLQCEIDGKIASIKSEGIAHPTLNKFGPTITGGNILFDNFKIWEIE